MTSTPAATASRPAARTMLVAGLAGSLPLVVVVPLLAWAAAGEWAGVSALIGAVLSVVVFALGVVGIRGVLAGPTASTMAGAFAVFVVQMAALAGVIWALGQTAWLVIVPLVVAFVLVGLGFQVGLVVGYLRSRSELDLPTVARAS
ncbi:hypothetical protein BJF86_01300 [Serinicoccus sp. CNJ-927]|uniref:hypothetical protein n=1 Tax=Serinicoccus sp. CNJ-927 TaxID=1904970 RepID=UPI000960C3B8|nr:hypothetical protein [Serinicoccus sp. CNJ-927]OLT43453.1 hypothetical protein BJF86_01300 [Serinicoccus sp. CNJ-927]